MLLGPKDDYKSGSWNVICDGCGFKFKGDELRKQWNGLMTCPTCWEPRHPQEMIKARREKIVPPYVRPEPSDVFVDSTVPPDWTKY